MQLRTIDLNWMFAIVVVACGGDKDVDGTTGGDPTGDTTVEATLGVSSTGEAPVPTSTAETTDDGTTGDGTTGAVTTGDGTTGEVTTGFTTGAPVSPDAMLCQQFCDKGDECGVQAGDAACMQTCLAELDVREAKCDEATTTLFQCFADLPCAQFVPLIDDGDPGPCAGIADQQEFVCALDGCDVGGGIDDDGTCSFEKSCRGEPLRRMACDLNSCTCFIADEAFASCAVEDACTDPFATAKRAAACCDF